MSLPAVVSACPVSPRLSQQKTGSREALGPSHPTRRSPRQLGFPSALEFTELSDWYALLGNPNLEDV